MHAHFFPLGSNAQDCFVLAESYQTSLIMMAGARIKWVNLHQCSLL